MFSRLLIPSLILLTLAPPLATAANDGLIVGLETIPNRIRHNNPALAAARFRIQEAIARNRAAGLRDNPELSSGLTQNHELNEGRFEVGISQRFPVTDRLQLEKKITAIEIAQAEAEVAEVERELIRDARTELVEILAVRQLISLRLEQIAVADELASFVSDAARRGELSSLDAGQSRLEAARLKSDLTRLHAAEIVSTGKIKPLLGMEATEKLQIAGQTLPTASVTEWTRAPEARPDYRAALLQTQAAQQRIDLEEAQKYDDIEVGVVAGIERIEDAPNGFENDGTLGLQIRIPLPFWDDNEGNIAAAKAVAERKQLEALALSKLIANQADAALREMLDWQTLLTTIDEELLPLAKKQAAESDTAYRQGLGDLQRSLLSRSQQIELSESRIESLRNFHLARVRYEAALGIN